METIAETVPSRGLFGLRLSWSAILSGCVTLLAVAALLWFLGMGITLVSVSPASLHGGLIALMVISAVITVIGAAAGGLVAGWSCRVRSRLYGGLHGLVACALAFIIATGFWMLFLSWALDASRSLLGTTLPSSSRFLEGLGYSATQSHGMLRDLQAALQNLLGGTAATSDQAFDSLLHFLGGAVWIYMAVWLAAMIVSLACGIAGATRLDPYLARYDVESVEPWGGEPLPPTTPPVLRPREV